MKTQLSSPSAPGSARTLFTSLSGSLWAAWAAWVTTCVVAANLFAAEPPFKVLQPIPGGIQPTPDIVSMILSNQEVVLKWQGFGGPYQLERREAADSGAWEPVGAPTSDKTLQVPASGHHGFLRVKGPVPAFATAESCLECHSRTHQNWSQTIHANAINSLKAIGQDRNPECLKCHTVGYGLPTGYKDELTTPSFAGIQCETCHGPAAAHAADPDRLDLRPIVTHSANLCGGCHNGFHHPTFDEWKTAGHGQVTPATASYFKDPVNGSARMQACGACHSGAVRMAMLKTVQGSPLELPTGPVAAETPVTCTVCHDSHKPNLDNTHSLRNPRYSTNFFSYSTSTNTSFAKQYKPEVQMCGQCHNMRGASPNDTSRPPHHSPQYNMLIGDIGVDVGYVPARVTAAHTRLQEQCTHCHTHPHHPDEPSESEPVYTGHAFEPRAENCTQCHESVQKAETLIASTQAEVRASIQEVKALLDRWSETKAPEALRAKYGKLVWEYTSAGQVSNPTGQPGVAGPTSKEQTDVPIDIKKARMYVYMVEHDGSYGVHNGKYARYLLGTAKTNVLNLIEAP